MDGWVESDHPSNLLLLYIFLNVQRRTALFKSGHIIKYFRCSVASCLLFHHRFIISALFSYMWLTLYAWILSQYWCLFLTSIFIGIYMIIRNIGSILLVNNIICWILHLVQFISVFERLTGPNTVYFVLGQSRSPRIKGVEAGGCNWTNIFVNSDTK